MGLAGLHNVIFRSLTVATSKTLYASIKQYAHFFWLRLLISARCSIMGLFIIAYYTRLCVQIKALKKSIVGALTQLLVFKPLQL